MESNLHWRPEDPQAMSDFEKAQRLLRTAPECLELVEQLRARGSPCSPAEFGRLAAFWQAAHGPCPDETLMAGFGWNVREENTLRWCLQQFHISIAAPPAHGLGGDHALPLGRERLESNELKHRIGED
jgi:hypothetical protein